RSEKMKRKRSLHRAHRMPKKRGVQFEIEPSNHETDEQDATIISEEDGATTNQGDTNTNDDHQPEPAGCELNRHEMQETVVVRGNTSTKKVRILSSWSKEDMLKAIDDIEFNNYSIRAAALKYNLPPTSVHYWLNGLTHTKRKGPAPVLSEGEEKEIVEWCKQMADLGHGVGFMQLRACVAQICETRETPFREGLPGKSWCEGFRKRHPDIVLRTAEGLERDRAIGLRPEVVSKFYEKLASIYINSYGAGKIWNCDETGIQAGRNCGMRVLATKGCRNVPKIIPRSREWMTILCCVNAAGQCIPNFYLFKGQKVSQNYIKGCEPGACMAAHPSAWMTRELFISWLYHFSKSVPGGVCPENRHLLIFDGHGSHVALSTIEEARRLGIDLLTLPAHTTHRLQPLDVSVFGPFKAYFRSERMQWMCNNKYQEVKRSDLAEIGSRALAKALTPANIRAGFRRTGIWPLDPNALQNDMECSKLYIIEEDANEEAAENVTDDDTTENIMNVDGTENIIDVDAAENILSLSRDVAPPVGDKIGENYLMESVENLSTAKEFHPTIETMVVANTETEEPSVQGERQSIMQTKDYEVNHIVNTGDQGTSSCNTEAQGFGEDDLSLPSAPEQPTWLQEHIAELGLDQIGNIEDESISLPSMPTNLEPADFEPANFTHYYADTEEIEVIDKDKNEEETTGHDVESGISNDGVAANEKKLGKFLRLPTQFVRDPSKGKSDAALRISRASQLLTSDAYVQMLKDTQQKKQEICEGKQRKKEHIEAKKQERLAAKEQKKEERLQRIKERQERDLQKLVERQEREKQREVARQKKELELQQKEATRHQREKEKQERDNKFNNPQVLFPMHHSMPIQNSMLQDMLKVPIPDYHPYFLDTNRMQITSTPTTHPIIPQPPTSHTTFHTISGFPIPPWVHPVNLLMTPTTSVNDTIVPDSPNSGPF
ncbi:hypothetical protein KI387_043059, partial [Taxus chinensis]